MMGSSYWDQENYKGGNPKRASYGEEANWPQAIEFDFLKLSICSKSHSQHRNVQFHRETKLIDFCCSTTSNKKKEYREQKAPLLLNHTVGQSTLSNQSHIFWLTYLSVVIKHTVANFSTHIMHCDLKWVVSTWIILLKMTYLYYHRFFG